MEKVKLQELKERMQELQRKLKAIIDDIQDNNLTNEQFALDFVDDINKMSVAF